MKLQFFILIFLALSLSHGLSQDPFYINYTIDDGLPSNEVYDVEIDNQGILWFSTDRGLCSFDSYQFTTYTTYNGLGDNVNFEIFKDSNGVLWFFGYNGLITLYENGIFSMYKYNDELKRIIKTVNGTHIKEIKEGSNQILYISCDTQVGNNYIELSRYSKPINYSLPPKTDSIQIDSFMFQYHLSHLHTKPNQPQPIFFKNTNYPYISLLESKSNINFVFDDKEIIWYTKLQKQGLNYISKSNKTIEQCLLNYEITNLRTDYNQGYWITTRNSGVLYVPNMNVNLITPYNKRNQKVNTLHFHEFSDHLLCGTSNSSILEINKYHGFTEHSTSAFNRTQDINHFQTVNNGEILRSTGFEMKYIEGDLSLSKSKTNRANIITSNGDIVSKSLRKYIVYTEDEVKKFDTKNRITCLIEDHDSNIWIGTLGELLKISNLDYSNPIEIDDSDSKSLGRITDIVVDDNNNIWICTMGNGLFVRSEDKMIHFNSDNGLTSNIANTLEVTGKSIWVATNNGLNLIQYNHSLEDLQFIESFNQSDGLNSSYINDVIEWNERIYVSSPSGICYFGHDAISKPKKEIPLNINSILINDKEVDKDSISNLRYNQNKIDIQYTAIRYNKSSDQILYKYRLSKNKQSSEWNYVNDRKVIFENLESGNYLFEVNATNKYGEWNPKSERIQFTICAHYSDTYWYKSVLLISILGTLFFISYYFIRRYQKSKAIELALEEARTRAKEAELSALRNQMNPHFIFNSLNTIQNFIFKKDVSKANFLLSKFSSLIRKSLEYSRLEAISINEEIEFLKDYIELEKVRFPDQIETTFEVSNKIDIFLDKIPSLLLQPLIENSIKHGISKSNITGKISIYFEALNNNYLRVKIHDTGQGDKTKFENKINHSSLGHQILKERIQILKSKGYPDTKFEISNLNQDNNMGYQVTLILPIL